MTADKLKAELSNLDQNKDTNIDNNEIENFLNNEENVRSLWDTMQDICDAQPEIMAEFKDITSKICEKILKNKNITINQWKILLFYLQHFHTEWDKVGNKIIKSKLKGNRFNETATAINLRKFHEQLKKDNKLNVDDWFNSLPWVKAIQEELEREWKDLQKFLQLLKTEGKLSEEDLQRLTEFKDNTKVLINPEDRQRAEERIRLETMDNSVIEGSETETANDILSNLDNIDPQLKNIKPNWQKLLQEIHSYEEVWKITPETIRDYLPLASNKYSEEDIYYISNNFQRLLWKHLCLHPNYCVWWWANPKSFATWMDIKNTVIEDNMIEAAVSKLDTLRSNKWNAINEIFKTNNHILFDLYLKEEIRNIGNNPKKIWKKLYEIMWKAEKVNKNKLSTFAKNNAFVKDLYEKYNDMVNTIQENEEIWKLINGIKDVTINSSLWIKDAEWKPVYKLKILTNKQLQERSVKYFKFSQHRESNQIANYFCTLYETSRNFYTGLFVKELWIPNSLDPQAYFDYLYSVQEMKKDVAKIDKEYQEEVGRISENRRYSTSYSWWWGALLWDLMYSSWKKSARTTERMVQTWRLFIELWKKSWGSYRPNNFYWIPLRWEKWPNADDIIRESFWEKITDKWDTFCSNLAGADIQKAVWDLGWLILWAVAGWAVTSLTWSAILWWAALEAWTRLGNWLVQWVYDLVIDWWLRKGLWWFGWETWNNRYDGFRDSFKLWIGKSKRDENWNVIDAISWWELWIDFTTDLLAWAATWWVNWNILTSPFKYAFIKDFVAKPILNTVKEWSKAWAEVGKYAGTWTSWWEAMWSTLKEEYTWWNLAKKAADVIIVWSTLTKLKQVLDTPRFKKYIDKVWGKFNSKLEEDWQNLAKLLKKAGVNLWDVQDQQDLCRKISQAGGSLTQWLFPSAVESYAAEATNTLTTITKLMSLPVFTYALVSDSWTPRYVLSKRIKYVEKKLAKSQPWSAEQQRYTKILERYKALDKRLASEGEELKWSQPETKPALPPLEQPTGLLTDVVHQQIQLDMKTANIDSSINEDVDS